MCHVAGSQEDQAASELLLLAVLRIPLDRKQALCGAGLMEGLLIRQNLMGFTFLSRDTSH